MPADHHNFAYTLTTNNAGTGTSITVTTGTGALFPATPFNATIWPSGSQALSTSAEIVRVTNITSDTFTVTRQAEGSASRTVVIGDQIAATITAQTLTDAERPGRIFTRERFI